MEIMWRMGKGGRISDLAAMEWNCHVFVCWGLRMVGCLFCVRGSEGYGGHH